MNTITSEFQNECQQLAAFVALEAADGLPLQKRIMIYRGIIPLLADGSQERAHAEAVADSLEHADKNQLRLLEILKNP